MEISRGTRDLHAHALVKRCDRATTIGLATDYLWVGLRRTEKGLKRKR